MRSYRIYVTTSIERYVEVEAEDADDAYQKGRDLIDDDAAFFPELPQPWEYSEADDTFDVVEDESSAVGR